MLRTNSGEFLDVADTNNKLILGLRNVAARYLLLHISLLLNSEVKVPINIGIL